MEKNLKVIVKKTLQEKYQINESFEKIFSNENQDIQFDETMKYFGKLIDEGYDNEKLEMVVNEQFDWLKKLFMGEPITKDSSVQDKLKSSVKTGAVSQFTEFLIAKMLSWVGFEGPLANAVATAMSEMKFADILAVFKSKESCMIHSQTVSKAIVEALIRYILETNTREDSLAYNFMRNTLSEYLANEGYTKKLGQFICEFSYKNKGSFLSKVGM